MYTSIVVDLRNDINGDIVITQGGDIDLSLHYDAIYEMIKTIISTPPKDSEILPLTSFDPDDFLGHIIDSDLLRNLKNAIINTISENSSLYKFDFDIQIFKITDESIAIIIRLLTIKNDYAVRAIFDTTSGSINSFIYSPSHKVNTDNIFLDIPLPETKLT